MGKSVLITYINRLAQQELSAMLIATKESRSGNKVCIYTVTEFKLEDSKTEDKMFDHFDKIYVLANMCIGFEKIKSMRDNGIEVILIISDFVSDIKTPADLAFVQEFIRNDDVIIGGKNTELYLTYHYLYPGGHTPKQIELFESFVNDENKSDDSVAIFHVLSEMSFEYNDFWRKSVYNFVDAMLNNNDEFIKRRIERGHTSFTALNDDLTETRNMQTSF